jgi:hypothetical protein
MLFWAEEHIFFQNKFNFWYQYLVHFLIYYIFIFSKHSGGGGGEQMQVFIPLPVSRKRKNDKTEK